MECGFIDFSRTNGPPSLLETSVDCVRSWRKNIIAMTDGCGALTKTNEWDPGILASWLKIFFVDSISVLTLVGGKISWSIVSFRCFEGKKILFVMTFVGPSFGNNPLHVDNRSPQRTPIWLKHFRGKMNNYGWHVWRAKTLGKFKKLGDTRFGRQFATENFDIAGMLIRYVYFAFGACVYAHQATISLYLHISPNSPVRCFFVIFHFFAKMQIRQFAWRANCPIC